MDQQFSSSSQKPPGQSDDELTLKQQELIASAFFGAIIVGLFITIIGGIWAIGDIFSENKFGSFLQLSLQTQIFIVGIIIVGIFFLSIFLVVLYRRGKNSLKQLLFKEKPEEKEREEYLAAKIITGGSLISIFVIFFGLFYAIVEYIVNKNTVQDTSGLWNFLNNLTGGEVVLFFGIIILVMTGLILGFFYLWQNGNYVIMHKIFEYNEKVSTPLEFTPKQKTIGKIIFVFFVLDILAIVAGIVWAIIDAVAFNWGETFRTYPFGIKFTIMGLFGSGLFGLLIIAMMLYKWGNYIILTALFAHFQPDDMDKDNLSAKVITVGILVGILLIFVSIVVWLSTLVAAAISGKDVVNLFEALAKLSDGLALMAYAILVAFLAILVLLFIFAFHNGYYYAMIKIMEFEKEIDKSFDKAAKKKKEKQSKTN